MLFGHKQHFAIEAYIEDGLPIPSTAWGRMCIWTEGVMIGRIDEEHCGIDNSADRLEELVDEFSSLWLEELAGLRDEEIFNRFDRLLYTGPLDMIVDPERAAQFWRFDFLTNWGEHTDGFKGCLVHHPEGELGMMIQLPDDSLICRRIDPDLFVHVAKAFVDWFRQESARLRPEE